MWLMGHISELEFMQICGKVGFAAHMQCDGLVLLLAQLAVPPGWLASPVTAGNAGEKDIP